MSTMSASPERPSTIRAAEAEASSAAALLVLDFGSQYSQLIARRVREAGVYCELRAPQSIDAATLRRLAPRGVILSGGPDTVAEGNAAPVPAAVFDAGVPILGICYGMQAMAVHFGGRVERAGTASEFGRAQARLLGDGGDLLGGALAQSGDLSLWMSHGDLVTELPPGFAISAATDSVPVAAMHDTTRRCYGLQFHPEVTHTPEGAAIIARFARDVCACPATWTAHNIVAHEVAAVRRQVGAGQVLLALSGGVDSAVAAVLLRRAIGEQLHCIFVNNGLLRAGEAKEVRSMAEPLLGNSLIYVDAADEFMTALAGVDEPERKRHIIGHQFINIFEREAKRLGDVEFLGQGTIYPDVIESAASSAQARLIKSHHNVGGLPDHMRLQLVEPLRKLFKDEVREVGAELDLPAKQLRRHPFPGPGLAVRVLGEVTAPALATLRAADAIFLEELRRRRWYHRVAQAFAVFLPVRSVGVTGDARRYEPVIALRAVETEDFMTARWARLPPALLATVAERIVNEVPGVSRVVYDISSKPPATVEWE